MQWFQAGEDFTLEIPLVVDGIPVQPDKDSTHVTIADHRAMVIPGLDKLPVEVPGTTIFVDVPSTSAQLEDGQDASTRFVSVAYKVNGKSHTQRLAFGVCVLLPISVTEDDVRGLIGVDSDELQNESIALISAYFMLLADYGADFKAGLISPDINLRNAANRAIASKAALEAIPSLQLRVLKARQAENAQYQRGGWVDFDKLRGDLESVLGKSLATLSNTIAQTIGGTPSIFIVSSPTDPITNS